MTAPNYNAVIRRDGEWWIGWIEEVPGVMHPKSRHAASAKGPRQIVMTVELRPPCFASSVAESAQSSVWECVSVMYLAPIAYKRRSTLREFSME